MRVVVGTRLQKYGEGEKAGWNANKKGFKSDLSPGLKPYIYILLSEYQMVIVLLPLPSIHMAHSLILTR